MQPEVILFLSFWTNVNIMKCREMSILSQEGIIINHFNSKCQKCVHAGISWVWLLSNHTLISALSDSLQSPGINTDSSTGSGPDKSSMVQLMQWLQFGCSYCTFRGCAEILSKYFIHHFTDTFSHPASSVKCFFSYDAFILFLCVCVTILIAAVNSLTPASLTPSAHSLRFLSLNTRALFTIHQIVYRALLTVKVQDLAHSFPLDSHFCTWEYESWLLTLCSWNM